MNTPTSPTSRKQAASQADVDKYIAQAHQMRADYMAKFFKSALASLRGLFSGKRVGAKDTVDLSSAH